MMVAVLDGGDLFQRPAEVGLEEGGCAGNAWQMVVVEEQDRAWAQKSPEVDQVDEHGIEAVVAVLSWRRPGRGGLSRKRAAQRLR
jgi:hypothetical protein